MLGFRTSVRRTAAAAILGLGATLGLVSPAAASSTTFTIPPGGRACLGPVYATSFVRAEGIANPAVYFTVNYSAYGSGYNNIFATFADFFAAEFREGENLPGSGYYKLCARNFSSTVKASVDMAITGY